MSTQKETAGEMIGRAAWRLAMAGIEDARRDARVIAERLLGLQPGRLLLEPELPVREVDVVAFDLAVADRAKRVPVSQILGEKEFWGLTFRVTADVLTPRPDTETVVETVLDHLPDQDAHARILDLGTGSGCLLLALLYERVNATGVGIDISDAARAVAQSNAERLGIADRARFAVGDWAVGVDGPFDVIVSNPPYIPSADIDGLEPEVRDHEPRGALDGGATGLAAYRLLIPQAARILEPGGLLAVEVGIDQAESVAAIMVEAGLVEVGARADLGGIPRCVHAMRPD